MRYIGPLTDQQSRLANMRLDEVYLGIWQQYLYRAGALVSDNQFMIQPGGAIEVMPEQGEKVGDVFSILDRKPVIPDAWQEDQYRQVQAEHAVAASDIMQGVSGGDRQTATEVERRLQQGNARHVLYSMWNDYTVKKELLERTWQWLQMRMTQPRIIRTVGEEYATVDISQIQVPIDIVVSGGMFALDQEMVMLAGNPVFNPYMRPGAILRKLMMDRGWRDPERYIKSDEEVMLEQAMAAQMGMGMGQQPGQEGGNGEQPPGENGEKDNTPGSQMAGGLPGAGGANNPMQDVRQGGAGAQMAGGITSERGLPKTTTGV
jgi:hypothetical protein